jgi:hypothetical protein
MRAVVALFVLMLLLLVVGGARSYRRRPCALPLTRVLRRWRPRTPDDCAHCRLAATDVTAPTVPTVRPWREGRSRRGAPHRIATAGYACRRRGCLYEGITDAGVHALVADGRHGRTDRIQDFRCRATR